MNREEIFKFMNNNPEFFLATCDGNEPRVRGMRLYQAKDGGVFFNTSKDKSLYRQLIKNSSVEMCFYDGDCTQVRIRGNAHLMENSEHKEQMSRKTPEMKSFIVDDKLALFRLKNAKVKVWKMDRDYIPRVMANFELDSIWMALYMGDEGLVERCR